MNDERTAIKAERKELERELRNARAAVELAQAKMKVLYHRCEHPNIRRVCTMGEMCDYCPDCGYQT